MEQDVQSLFVQTITGDATIRTLTGWRSDDPRLYYYHKGDAVIDPTRPAYMTYLMTASPESSTGVRPTVVSIIIWGERRDKVLAVRGRLQALLNKKTLLTTTGRRVRTRNVGENDTFNEAAEYVGRQMQIRLAYLDP